MPRNQSVTNESSNNETPRDATADKDVPPPERLMASVLGVNGIGSEAQRDRGHVPTASTLKISDGVIGESLDIGRNGSCDGGSMLKEMLTHNASHHFQ